MTARDRTRAALRAASDRLSSPPVRMFLEFVGVVTGSVLVAAAPNPPTTTPQVAQMVGGAVLGGAAGRGVRVVVVTLGEIRCAGGGLPTIVGTTGATASTPTRPPSATGYRRSWTS